jgi:hypothetical protein
MNMRRMEIIEKIRETVVEDAHAFVEEKGHDEKSVVINLETGEYYAYLLPPINALKAARVANIMRKVGRICDAGLVVHFSASKEFEYLDKEIEFAANNNLLRLGELYTYATAKGKDCIEDMAKQTMLEHVYRKYY